MTRRNRRLIRRPALSRPSWSLPWLLFSLAFVGAVFPGPVAAQGDDLCFPEEFSTTNAIYFPFENDVVISPQWFSLPAQRERIHSFPNDTEIVAVIDAYDLGSRFSVIGTHTLQTDFSFHTCLVLELPNPVQEVVCFGQGLERRSPIAMAHSPLHRSTLEDNDPQPEFVRLDGTWTEVGSVSVPARILERVLGNAFVAIEFWNTRLEVDPTVFDIPEVCDGVTPTPNSSALLPELYGAYSQEQLRHLPAFRNLGPNQTVTGDSSGHSARE